jgi:hypothetical protein
MLVSAIALTSLEYIDGAYNLTQSRRINMYSHFISFETTEAYSQFIRSMDSDSQWDGVEVVEFTPETDGAGNPYHLLTLKSSEELPDDLELEVCRFEGVLATTFNIAPIHRTVNKEIHLRAAIENHTSGDAITE